MKEIRAYVRREKLEVVAHALRSIEGLTGMSVVQAHGFGRGRGSVRRHPIEQQLETLAPHVKLEVVCGEESVELVIQTILAHARTGLRGDGKIYVSPVDEAIRISTGERGRDAV